jgi:hypothetical protein
MAMENLKPTIWTRFLITALQKSLIFANLANQNYEGEATVGGSVKFNQIGEVDVNDYTAYTDMTFQQLDDASLSMVIAQKKYFAFQIDETDERFIPVDTTTAGINRGAYRIRDTIDSYISGKYGDAGVTYGSAASPKATSSGTVVQHLAEFYETMTENNIPLEDRWIALPPWVFTKLTLAGVSDKNPNTDTFRNGYIGPIVGFQRVFMSNNVTKIGGTAHTILASSGNEAIGYAGAIDGNIRIRPAEKRRAMNVDGLWVYDAKVIRPDMLACMYSTETAN